MNNASRFLAVALAASLSTAFAAPGTESPEMLDSCELRTYLSKLNESANRDGILGNPSECIETKLVLLDSDNYEILTIKDRYISAHTGHEKLDRYQIIEASSGGSGCCTQIYFIDEDGNSTRMPNSSPSFEIKKEDGFYLITSSNNKQLKLPK